MARDKGDDTDKAALKAEKKAAKKAARKAEKQAGKTAGEARPAKQGPAKEVIVSPLAPERFPELPVVQGVAFVDRLGHRSGSVGVRAGRGTGRRAPGGPRRRP